MIAGILILFYNVFYVKDTTIQLNAVSVYISLITILFSFTVLSSATYESRKGRRVAIIDTTASGKGLEEIVNSELAKLNGKTIDSININDTGKGKNVIIIYH